MNVLTDVDIIINKKMLQLRTIKRLHVARLYVKGKFHITQRKESLSL